MKPLTQQEKELINTTIIRAYVDADMVEQRERLIEVANLLEMPLTAKTLEDNLRASV